LARELSIISKLLLARAQAPSSSIHFSDSISSPSEPSRKKGRRSQGFSLRVDNIGSTILYAV
jgi:hypothetical protein